MTRKWQSQSLCDSNTYICFTVLCYFSGANHSTWGMDSSVTYLIMFLSFSRFPFHRPGFFFFLKRGLQAKRHAPDYFLINGKSRVCDSSLCGCQENPEKLRLKAELPACPELCLKTTANAVQLSVRKEVKLWAKNIPRTRSQAV